MKKIMSVSAKMFLGKTVLGFLWLTVAITNMFESILWIFCSCILLAAAVTILIIMMKIEAEEDDEMSLFYYKEAQAKSSDIMHVIFAVLSVLFSVVLTKLDIADLNWPNLIASGLYALMGIQNIIIGITYKKLEAE